MAAMDETTFQRELCELKQRASEMASSPSPAPSVAQLSGFMLSNALQNDLFVAQLRDVRTRLDIMQASLVKSQVEKETVEARSPQYVTTDLSRSEAFQVLNLTVHGLQDLTVRCHRDTSDRLGRLEQAISGLQGTLAFTPAASETTIEDLHASQESHYFESTDEPEPKSDAAVHDFFDQQDQERPATIPQVLEETLTGGVTIPQPFMTICPPKLDEHPQLLPDAVDTSSTTATFDDPHNANLLSKCGDNLEATREDVAGPQNAVSDDITQIAKGLTTELDVFEEFEARLSAKDAVIAHLKTCRQAADEASQITRTDLESRLAECEDQFVRWKQEADAAHGGFEAMARCNRELRAAHDLALGRMKQDLKHCEASRHHFMTKYVDENYRYKWLEQKKLQSEQNLCQRLDECERALQVSERKRDSDIRDAMQSRDEELDQLYAFCQEKYDIVSHQERIIAQGTSILQDRDAEIDSLHIALADSKRERRHVQERASNFKRTLRNRDDEIEDLKCVIREEKDRRRRAEALVRKEAESKTNKSKDVRFRVDEEKPSRPLAQAIDAVGNGHEVGEQPMWTPQPIRSSKLPREEVRASLWEDDVRSAPDHQFGTASPIARRRKPDAKDDVIGERAARDNEKIPAQHFGPSIADLRDTTHGQRGSQVPHREHRWHNGAQRGWNPPEAQSDASSGRVIGGRSSRSGMEAQATANSGTAENRRHALPLDLTWLPPLPARASASASASMGKMSSVPNLRAGGHQQDGRNAGAISKPASMLELRPQKYHAPSVETEAESAEDRGGSSLLDR